jgi:3-hydroxyacyl-CoA dehydrogenase
MLNRRVVLHAVDATPARWRGDAGSSPLDRTRTAALSPRNDCVKNYRVHPTLVDYTGAEDILDRALLALVNEGFRVLEEGLALRPSDLDVVWTSGYGFPRHKGGPMQWAEERGLRECRATLERLAAERPDVPYLRPSKLLVALAEADAPLADWEKYV